MFTWSVKVDETNIAPIVLAGGQIEYGRQTLNDQPAVPFATIELLTRDASSSVVEDYPEFGLGDWASDLSGFDDDYQDAYEGVTSRITIGVPVVISAGTESGFTDAYADAYAGIDFTRFTGRVQAIDYTPGSIQLTATPRSEEWARILVGGTGVDQTIPVETEAARAIRYAAEAGIDLIVDGAPTVAVIEVGDQTPPSSLAGLLLELMADTGGIVFTDRDSFVHIRTSAWVDPDPTPTVTLPPETTLLDPLAMSLDLGLVRNRVTITYGPEAVQGGGAVFSARWRYETGTGAPSAVGRFRGQGDGSPAPGESMTLWMSHTDTNGLVWDFAGLTSEDQVRVVTDAGDVWAFAVDSFTTPVTGPTGYTTITGILESVNGTITNNEYANFTQYSPVVRTRPTVTVEDPAQIAQYGVRDFRTDVIIQNAGDATTQATRLLDFLSPQWVMPSAEVALALAHDQVIAEVCGLEQGDKVILPQLLLGSPDPTYEAEVLGYTETLSRTDWRIALHLSPQLAYPAI